MCWEIRCEYGIVYEICIYSWSVSSPVASTYGRLKAIRPGLRRMNRKTLEQLPPEKVQSPAFSASSVPSASTTTSTTLSPSIYESLKKPMPVPSWSSIASPTEHGDTARIVPGRKLFQELLTFHTRKLLMAPAESANTGERKSLAFREKVLTLYLLPF